MASSTTIVGLLLMALLLFTPVALAANMVVEVPQVLFYQEDLCVMVLYHGSDSIYLVSSQHEGLTLRTSEYADAVNFSGQLLIAPSEFREAQYKAVLAFFSSKPFTVKVFLTDRSLKPLSKIGVYKCPGNVTIQFVIPIAVKGRVASNTVEEFLPGFTIPYLPAWELAIYAAVFPLFIVAAFLDLGDMKRSEKRKRWTKLDSFALVVRYLFYACFFSFLLILLASFCFLVYGVATRTGAGFSLTDLIISFSLFAGFSTIYLIAKWRGWYDLIDEE